MERNSARETAAPFVSVVIPVRNGAGRIEHCIASLNEQDYPTDRYEIIVVDGGSTDDTVGLAEGLGATVVDNPRINAASGRNIGIGLAQGVFVAISDDDCVLPSHWLRTGVGELQRSGAAAVGGPTPIPSDSSAFSRAVNLIFRFASTADSSVQSDVGDGGMVTDIPGGNAMYRREVLLAVGQMNEDLVSSEDVEIHLRLQDHGHDLLFCRDFAAEHRKRDSPKGLFLQMRRFARGYVQLGRIRGEGMGLNHWLAGVALPLFLLICAAMVAYGQAVPLLAAIVIGWVVLTGIALLLGEGPAAAVLFAPAILIFLSGWAYGWWSELLRPAVQTSDQ